MLQATSLVDSLKRELKTCGITYAALAARINTAGFQQAGAPQITNAMADAIAPVVQPSAMATSFSA